MISKHLVFTYVFICFQHLSDIFETLLCFLLPLCCVKPPKIVVRLVHLNEDCTDNIVYKQLLMGIKDRYCHFSFVCTDRSQFVNSVTCDTVFH